MDNPQLLQCQRLTVVAESRHCRNSCLKEQLGLVLILLGVTMVLLTTIPIGRLLLALASIMHERCQVILEVLPLSTFMELARIQIALWVLPTHT